MVFLTVTNLIRSRGPDEFWRKRRIFRLAAHYIGRRRNCYTIAIRYVHRALVFATKGRRQRRLDDAELWNSRIEAAAQQHNLTAFEFREGLDRAGVQLDRKSLSNLASWEPSSFSALAALAQQVCRRDDLTKSKKDPPTGLDLRYDLFLGGKFQK